MLTTHKRYYITLFERVISNATNIFANRDATLNTATVSENIAGPFTGVDIILHRAWRNISLFVEQ